MKRVLFAVALMIALCSLASASITEGTPSPNLNPVFGTWVNFDDVAAGNPVVSNHYLGVGVSSVADANNQLYYFDGTQSLPNYVGTGPGVGWAMDTTITLVNPTSQIGIGLAGPGTVTLAVFDASGASIESYTFPFLSNDYYYFTEGSSDIKSLEITSSFIAIDDLQFYPGSSVPEPSTILMMVSGLGSLAFARFRRS
ncbi:MAG: PEP-CTERM sorting domain-containing protein [Candidatus Korobacteraceae bacterium]